MFVLRSGRCSCASMPPTGSSSSSRSSGGRCPPTRPRGPSCGSGAPSRSASRAHSSTRPYRPTRAFAGRVTWSGSQARRARSSLLEEASFVVFDLETTGLRPGYCAAVRVRRGARGASRADRALRDARQSRCAAAARDRGADRASRRRSPSCPAGRRGRAALPLVRRRRGTRRAQRALRHGVPRPRDEAADGPAGRGHGRGHGWARAAAARPPAREPRRTVVPLRDRCAALSPRVAGRGGDRRDSDPADWHGAGTRRKHRRRPRRARRDPAPARPAKAELGLRRTPAPRRLLLPRQERSSALCRPRTRPARPAALLLPLGTTAPRG